MDRVGSEGGGGSLVHRWDAVSLLSLQAIRAGAGRAPDCGHAEAQNEIFWLGLQDKIEKSGSSRYKIEKGKKRDKHQRRKNKRREGKRTS